MGEMDAYKDIFLSESAEYIQSIVDGLLALEDNPTDLEPVETVFRGAHSLKGMSATMGYERTADLTHRMEGLMDTVRNRERAVDSDLVDLMLRAVDAVKVLIEAESEGLDDGDVTEIVAELTRFTGSDAAKTAEAASAAPSQAEAAEEGGEGPLPGEIPERELTVTVTLEEACVLKAVRAYMAIKRLSHMGSVLDTIPGGREIEDEQFERSFQVILRTPADDASVRNALMAISEIDTVEVEEAHAGSEPAEDAATPEAVAEEPHRRVMKPIPKLAETQTVRISIGHLDNMVNLMGELVIIHSRLAELAKEVENAEMLHTLEEFHRVSAEMQHEVMQTRMVPVGNIFNRFPRMVRDLAHDLGKDITFEMDGLDIELDRTVLDEIGDPIVHLLRNSVDHGIEIPRERKAAGKAEKGSVRLVAARERDQVTISVFDDGKGIDVEKVWDRACERGLAQRDSRATYTADEVIDFVCQPGFSTADTATKVSGRGVGMDVVRGKIEYLGGSLSIRSTEGEGSAFVLRLPLTLAIIQALLVESKDQVFALPLGPVTEVLSQDEIGVETVDGGPVVVLRDGTVAPLHKLDAILGRAPLTWSLESRDLIVLLEIGDEMRALAVDRLVGRTEIVIKPLARMLKHLKGLGGATVLGDGRVALILDPRTLFLIGDDAA